MSCMCRISLQLASLPAVATVAVASCIAKLIETAQSARSLHQAEATANDDTSLLLPPAFPLWLLLMPSYNFKTNKFMLQAKKGSPRTDGGQTEIELRTIQTKPKQTNQGAAAAAEKTWTCCLIRTSRWHLQRGICLQKKAKTDRQRQRDRKCIEA